MRRLVAVAEAHVWAFERWGLRIPVYRGDDGAAYVPIRPVCEQLGINVSGQLARMREDKHLIPGVAEMPAPTDGGVQKSICLRTDECAWWLATIEPSRVREGVRDDLEVMTQALIRYAGAMLRGETTTPLLAPPPLARRVIALSSRDVIVLDCDCGRRWRVTVVNGEATIEPEG